MAKAKVLFNKVSLSGAVQMATGSSLADAERAVQTVFDTISARVDNGEQVSVAGFGIFEKQVRVGRKGRNPRTGDEVNIPNRFVVKFRPSIAFKRLVNQAK